MFAIAPLDARCVFLEKFASVLNEYDEEGSVAEAGAFEGDFAEYISEYFLDKSSICLTHLMDLMTETCKMSPNSLMLQKEIILIHL